MEWIKRLSEFNDSWEMHKDKWKGQWRYECYLSCYHHYEDFDYVSMGEGETMEDAVVAAFTDWDKKHDSGNS